MMKKLLSRKEAAEYLSISLDRLDEARRGGEIEYIQYVENGRVFFTEEALEAYITRCTHQPRLTPSQATYRKRRIPRRR